MKAGLLLLIFPAIFAAIAFAQERKPIVGHLAELPSLGITRDDALRHLDDFKQLKQRESLTPGIENWWAHTDEQQIVYSLKCVKDKIIAVSIEIPGILPPEKTELYVKRTVFAVRALANADKNGKWDKVPNSGLIGRLVGEVINAPYKTVTHVSGDNLLLFVYFSKRNAVQINVLPIRLFQEYELDGL
jgi:hypothetical protein